MSAELKPESSKSTILPQLLLGFAFGMAFGFLLQKGGVAKYNVLMGVLLLEDFTVAKVMLSAVLVGMVGIYFMYRAGMIEFELPVTQYGANIIGGLVFGVGFGLSAYCPGTNAAAIGQGNFDGFAVVAGMIAGSWIFAEASGTLKDTVQTWGDRGKETLPELLNLPRGAVTAVAAVILIALLLALEVMAPR